MQIPKQTFYLTEHDKGFFVKIKNANKPFYLKEKEYYLDLAQLVEALKVEGYWNVNGNMSISSKTPELIILFGKLFIKHKINTRTDVTIKTQKIPNLKNKKIIIIENGEPRNFHLGRNGFTQELDRIVFNTQIRPGKFKIIIDNQTIDFDLKVDSQFLKCNDKSMKIYYTLKASNKSFVKFCESVLEEKNKSSEIRINEYLKYSSPEIITKVFGILMDCEGSVRYKGVVRNLNVQMISKDYLHDWKDLLEKINIACTLSKHQGLYQLTITSYQNFKKLDKLGFELNHPAKKERFENILAEYKKHQFQRNCAMDEYRKLLLKYPGLSSLELANKINRNKRVVSHYLKKLVQNGKATQLKVTKQKYIYFPEN